MGQKVAKHISIKIYQDIIIKELANKTNRNQVIYYRMALDEFIRNHCQEIQKEGITSNFLKEKFKNQPSLLHEMPSTLKKVYGLEKGGS